MWEKKFLKERKIINAIAILVILFLFAFPRSINKVQNNLDLNDEKKKIRN